MSDETTTPKPRRRRRATRRRGSRGRRDQAGVALIMVLAAIALMFVMAEQTRDEVEVYSSPRRWRATSSSPRPRPAAR
jgi:hypothetical protein